MIAILFGMALIAFTVCACLPNVLGWSEYIVFVLKGLSPIIAALVGIIAIFIGFADIQDKKEARKEEKEAEKAAQNQG
ncbi:hypothetical protein [Treponema pectinovorum]|uniref:hypothetical protein n=1 Tax=Treponema pectinovorum TaxID=164 RepID=UPI0011CBB07D|nr:hypothetical protein [Treponema pectinovorum]